MDNIKIIQHNVLYWKTRKFSLTQAYKEINPHIILINSHGLKTEEHIKIPGYTTYQKNSTQELSDGSAILIKNNIKHRTDDDYITDLLEIIIETEIGEIGIATTYLPPRRPFLPYPDFHRLASKNIPTYLFADLNANIRAAGYQNTNQVGRSLERLINNGKLTFMGPQFSTFHDRRSSTTPDIALGNNKTMHNITIDPGPLTESDHIPLIITLTTSAITNAIPPKPIYNKANWDLFTTTVEREMREVNIEQNMTIADIDTAISKWYTAIEKGTNLAIPTSTQEIIQQPITSPLLKQIQYQYTQLRQASQTHGWTLQNFYRYRMLKVMLKNEAERIRNNNWTKLMEKTALKYQNPQDFWRTIRKLKGNTCQQNQYLQQNNRKITKDEDKEEIHRAILENVFRITREENAHYDQQTEEDVTTYLDNNEEIRTTYIQSDLNRLQGRNMIDTLITEQEIKSTINAFKNNTPGSTNINKIILKHAPDNALKTIQTIFNHTLSLGYFPTKFKTALIKMIPKANTDCTDPRNFRPISLLEVPGKILEKIINRRVREHLETHNILTEKQHGFRSRKGTDTALTTIHETIAHHIARKSQVYVVLRDVSKAFDKVWHNGLKFKVAQLQLPVCITKLLNNFIINRKARIKIGSFTGPEFALTAGVPQGSALSPTLYTIYTNDIPDPAVDCTTIQYADDITQIIAYHGKSRHLMANRTTSEIEKINEYEKKWKIKTNKNKFKIIPLAVKKKNDIVIDGTPIQYSESGKVLGIRIGTSGYNKHLKETANKGTHALRELQRFYALSTKIKLHLVKAFILPILTYAPIPLITASNTNLKKLQVVQNKGLRFAFNERYPYNQNTRTLHTTANIEPINYRLYLQAEKVFNKLTDQREEIFTTLLEDYEEERNHAWFRKTKTILERGPPPKIYTA